MRKTTLLTWRNFFPLFLSYKQIGRLQQDPSNNWSKQKGRKTWQNKK